MSSHEERMATIREQIVEAESKRKRKREEDEEAELLATLMLLRQEEDQQSSSSYSIVNVDDTRQSSSSSSSSGTLDLLTSAAELTTLPLVFSTFKTKLWVTRALPSSVLLL